MSVTLFNLTIGLKIKVRLRYFAAVVGYQVIVLPKMCITRQKRGFLADFKSKKNAVTRLKIIFYVLTFRHNQIYYNTVCTNPAPPKDFKGGAGLGRKGNRQTALSGTAILAVFSRAGSPYHRTH